MIHTELARPKYFQRIIFWGCMVIFTAGIATAQSPASQNPFHGGGYSSSQAGPSAPGVQMAELALPDSPEPAGSGHSSQNGNGGADGSERHGFLHRNWAFEAGGGFNAPISNGSIAYGSNYTLGAGRRFNEYLSGLIEFQYINNKVPISLLTAADARGAGVRIGSFTVDPVVDLFPKSSDSLYITGGGGFYRVLTSLSNPSNSKLPRQFSSNQGGVNIGCGYQHRIGSMFGASHATIFAEARYLDVLTPQEVQGTSTVAAGTKLVPVNFGVRF